MVVVTACWVIDGIEKKEQDRTESEEVDGQLSHHILLLLRGENKRKRALLTADIEMANTETHL